MIALWFHKRSSRLGSKAAWLVAWLLCFVIVVAVSAWPACAAAPQLLQLTNDGRSLLEFGGGCSPQGNLVAYVYKVTDQSYELRILDLDTKQSHAISSVGLPYQPVWSLDGSKLAFFYANALEMTSETTLMIWDAATGEVKRTALQDQLGNLASGGIYWSPDNTRLVMTVNREGQGRVLIVPVDGSPVIEVGPNIKNMFFTELRPCNIWSADGSRLAFINYDSNTNYGEIWTCDSSGQDLKPISKRLPNLWGIAWSWDGKHIAYTTAEGMTDTERAAWFAVIWVMDADGGNPRQLTFGSDPAMERRTLWRIFDWTKDNRYVIAMFEKQDEKGDNRYRGFDLVDGATGEIVRMINWETGASETLNMDPATSWKEASDSRHFTIVANQYTVRGPRGGAQTREDKRTVVRVYSLADRTMTELLTYHTAQDRSEVSLNRVTWTSDSRNLLLRIDRIVSAAAGKTESDLYLLPVPQDEATAPPAAAPPTAPASAYVPAPPPTAPSPELPPTPPAAVAASPAGPPCGVAEIVVRHRRAAEVANLLPPTFKGSFAIDEGRNSLLLAADAPTLAALRDCVTSLDNPVPHIMVDVLVTDLSKDANRELGLDWEFGKGRFGALLPFGLDLGTPGSIFYQGVGKLDRKFFTTLSLLTESGKATVRANPRVLATSGKEANITIRRTDFFLYASGTDYLGHPSFTRSDISADTVLKITPVLLGDGKISVRVDATVDSFTFARANDLPDTTRRQATTEVICGDGESIVIGGLTQQEAEVTYQKTPLLGDLPLLGQLFRHTQRRSRESTLVIFITPRLSANAVPAAGPGL